MRLCLRRREFIAGLGGAAAAWPLGTQAQQRALPVVGYVSVVGATPERERAFRQGLGEAGYGEGRNVTVEYQRNRPALQRCSASVKLARRPPAHALARRAGSGEGSGLKDSQAGAVISCLDRTPRHGRGR